MQATIVGTIAGGAGEARRPKFSTYVAGDLDVGEGRRAEEGGDKSGGLHGGLESGDAVCLHERNIHSRWSSAVEHSAEQEKNLNMSEFDKNET